MSDGPAELVFGLTIWRMHMSGDDVVSTPVSADEFFAQPCPQDFTGCFRLDSRYQVGDCACGALNDRDCRYQEVAQ